jgi:ABC-2 type transport system ATP-binding protein
VVKEIVHGGRTVLYTTHYLEEAEELCDRLAIIDHGKILASGSVDELKAQVGQGALLTVSGSFRAEQVQAVLQRVEGLRAVEVTDAKAMLLAPSDGNGISRALEGLFSAGLDFDDVNIKEPNLEDLFLKLTGRELRD